MLLFHVLNIHEMDAKLSKVLNSNMKMLTVALQVNISTTHLPLFESWT